MRSPSNAVIVDSSALVALMTPADSFHQRSLAAGEEIRRRRLDVLIPYDILSETVTAVAKLVGREKGVEVVEEVLSRVRRGDFVLVPTGEALVRRAAGFLQTAKGAKGAPSFFDCLVMAVADTCRTPYIFGYDEVFPKNGFWLPDESNRPDM